MSAYDYPLESERIASRPVEPRDACRLLVVEENGAPADAHFRELAKYLPTSSLLVLNDTRVVQARLYGRKATGGVVELLLLEPCGALSQEEALTSCGRSAWRCLVKGRKRWKRGGLEIPLGERGPLYVSMIGVADRAAEAADEQEEGDPGEELLFEWEGGLRFSECLEIAGRMPIPPYLKRASVDEDCEWYQTAFARESGSVAAPTAGLHFTADLLDSLRYQGIGSTRLTLHVGAGTFLPVKSATLGGHPMHAEPIRVERAFLEELLAHEGPVVPVGTTSLRSLESIYQLGRRLALNPKDEPEWRVDQWAGYDEGPLVSRREALSALLDRMRREEMNSIRTITRLLIAPGYPISMADYLITNFHQPGSTLLLLIDAFMGARAPWRRAYAHALEKDYRFLSYGDAMLIRRGN